VTDTPANVTTPPDLTYGYVDGRIILAIGDRSDAGRTPDPVPADGMTVTFTPANTILKVTTPTPATVIKQPIVCSVDANGYLIDGQEARGVWLVTGTYKVTYSHPRALIPSHDIEVTTGHTEAAPLDLTTAMPPGGPVLTPSEYAELNGRLTILEAAGTSSLTIGTTSTTAKAGDWTPTWTDVTGKPSTFPPDTEATQDIIGAMVAGAGGTYNDAAGTITLPGGFDPVQFSIGYSGAAVPTLAASSFVTVTYGPATPSTNVGGGTFDTGTGIYTVPATGRYLILARVRAEDNMTARSVGVGVHGSNADGPYFVWRTTGAPRDVLTYQRVDSFTAGTQLRTFIYSEGGTYPLIAAALTIDRIG
jgi:hypothetical protein